MAQLHHGSNGLFQREANMTEHTAATDSTQDKLADAIALANIPALACLLVQLTGERRWIEGRYVPTRTRGLDDNDSGGLSAGIQTEIRSAACAAIRAWFDGKPLAMPNPSDDLLVQMMGVSLGEEIPLEYAPMIREELGLQQSAAQTPAPLPGAEGFSALVIGAGISGICAAVELQKAGIACTLLERNEQPGGVWLENRYPGAACDVPSHLYSYSFAPYDWSKFFAGRDEIHAYLQQVAQDFNVMPRIRFGCEVTQARYDETSAEWTVDVLQKDGTRQSLRANVLISAVGAFNKPRFPNVSGIERFKGPSVHTARWPENDVDLKGRRVVVIGNGASAMQVVPAIADEVASLTIIQRSPQWAAPFPRFKLSVPEPLQWLLREMPLYRLWYRLRLSWAFNDKQYAALQKDPAWEHPERSINALNDAHRRALSDYISRELGERQDLLPQVVPDYPPFGKRMLLDNGWFRTLAREHVELVTGAVTEVLEDRVRTSAGTEHQADVLIWATGFDVVNFLAPMRVTGRAGHVLHDDWDGDDARAYVGTVVPGYPNFFCLYGPNTQFGHGGSLITVMERQMHYVMSLLRQMLERGIAAVEVRQDIHDAYNAKVDRTHDGMVWTHQGMDTYYRNSKGRVVVNNPFRIIEFWRMVERANLDEYLLTPAAARTEGH
jgi:4-hydroxyacetophenone monooxygenase